RVELEFWLSVCDVADDRECDYTVLVFQKAWMVEMRLV
ncbi:MAG: hypothetical protein RL564_273, partial [Pseudomonadota bacterium]